MEWWNLHGHQVISTIVFSVIGIVLFLAFFAILPKLLPFLVKKEMEEDQNVGARHRDRVDRDRDGDHHRGSRHRRLTAFRTGP